MTELISPHSPTTTKTWDFLKIYLVATGILSAIALMTPGAMGIAMALVLPAILIFIALTGFLWGIIFTLFWWVCSLRFRQPFAVPLAGLATSLLFFFIPSFAKATAERWFNESLLPDKYPARAIKLEGNILVESDGLRYDTESLAPGGIPYSLGTDRPYVCDRRCMTLLFIPGVTSVTLNGSFDFSADQHRESTGPLDFQRARTYKLIHKKDCEENGAVPNLNEGDAPLGTNIEENEAIKVSWKLKLANEYCLRVSTPIETYDLRLRNGHYSYPKPRDNSASFWSLRPTPANIRYIELRDGNNTILFRKMSSAVSVLRQPLIIGSTYSNWMIGSFGWIRAPLSHGQFDNQGYNFSAVLPKYTTLMNNRREVADPVSQVRNAVRGALNDPNQ